MARLTNERERYHREVIAGQRAAFVGDYLAAAHDLLAEIDALREERDDNWNRLLDAERTWRELADKRCQFELEMDAKLAQAREEGRREALAQARAESDDCCQHDWHYYPGGRTCQACGLMKW